jgi:DNA-binding beta-propeller fold protein YncE
MEKRLLAGFALVLLLISGCSRGRNSGSLGGGGIGTSTGQLYVSTNSSILRFSGALTATGNLAPTATITGSATLLSTPEHLIVDPSADRLFVANQGGSSILVFDLASHTTGNAAPTRTISGASTLLAAPHDLALDAGNNLLYVADGTQILVFQSAGTINGNVPPVHNISMGFAVGAIFVDAPNNRLYVADTSGNAISRLEGASLQNGTAVVAATISGAATGLAHPQGLALDSSGRLIVSNAAGPSLTIYASAATASRNVSPAATLSGAATQLSGPDQILLNQGQNNGELYVADNLAGAILVFTNLASATGNVAPARSISGSATGLVPNGVNGVALDATR